MTDQDTPRFTAAMVALYKAFGKKEDADVSKILFLTLKHLTIEDAEQCISQAILNCERFPTPFELKRCVSLIPRREAAKVEYKPSENPKMAEQAFKLINGILDGRLSRDQAIEGMMYMHKLYPGAGWASEAAKLTQYYRGGTE